MNEDDTLYCLSEASNLLTRVIDSETTEPSIRAWCEQGRDAVTNAMLDLQTEQRAA